MKKLHLLFAACIMMSSIMNAQDIGIETIQPKLTSMANISAFYEINDIGFYKGIINEPAKALEYEGANKSAANMGVYLADMIYGINAKSLTANESFGAVLQLAEKVGLADQFTQLIIDRINSKTSSAEEVAATLDEILQSAQEKYTKEQKTEYYNFLLYGNYIEKLHLISSVLDQAQYSNLPASAKANLNRSLLQLMAKQGEPLKELSKLMVDYSSNIVAHRDIQALLKSYDLLKKNAPEIVKLDPAEIFKAKEIKDIQKGIKKIRTRIVD